MAALTTKNWRITAMVTVLIILQAMAAVLLFGTKPAGAWFGTGSCPMPGGFVSGQKCLAVDANGVEVPWKGEIILPKDTVSITDHAFYNGTNPVAGNYELQLVEDNGTCCTVYQTIDYTVAANGATTPASFPLNSAILTEAFSHHLVGTGGLIGYFLYISNGTALPAGAVCQNTVSFIGATGSLGSGTSAGGEKCNTPTPVPGSGSLAGHVIDCTSGMPAAGDIVGATIAVTSGPTTRAAAANPVNYPLVPTGAYVETATVPAGYHFVYTCGGTSQGSPSVATAAVTVPLQGSGVANFYVARDSGILVGHVYDCTGGVANLTADVAGSTVAASGPVTAPAKPSPAQWSVPTGTYTMTATAPTNFHLVECNGAGAGSQQVVVPVQGQGTGTFYVARDSGNLSADIFDCSAGVMGTTNVPGGTVGATGPTMVAPQANPLGSTSVIPGAYKVSATAPAAYHFAACGNEPATGVRDVTVPANGPGHAVFYVTHDTGMLAGHIYDCSNGASTTEVAGGTLAAAGVTPVVASANPLAPTVVSTGDYVVTATAPPGYMLADCNGRGAGPQDVTVPSGGTATAVFYVQGRGMLDIHVYDCTAGLMGATDVPGGTVSAAGPTTIASQANPLPATSVRSGDYTANAIAPTGYHLVSCGGQSASEDHHLTVPPGGAGHAVYYVTHDTGSIAVHIYDCTNGATTTEVNGGTVSVAGATKIPAQANPIGPVVVQTGAYTVSATAPSGYTLAACNGNGAGSPQPVSVPANPVVTTIFYVTKNPGTTPGTTPASGTKPVQGVQGVQAVSGAQGVLGAGTTQPNTGRGDLLREALASLLLIVAGGAIAVGSRRARAI